MFWTVKLKKHLFEFDELFMLNLVVDDCPNGEIVILKNFRSTFTDDGIVFQGRRPDGSTKQKITAKTFDQWACDQKENFGISSENARISQGTAVSPNEHRWPWIVRLKLDQTATCGAVIISTHAIMTG